MTRRSGLTLQRRASQCLVLALALGAFAQVEGNFFSRLLKVDDKKNKDTKSQPPSGVTAATGSEAQVGSVVTFDDGMLMANLSNNNKVPLVGVGVGNAHHAFVGALVADAIQDDKKIRLIDTSHASHNEALVAEGLVAGVETLTENRKDEKDKKIQIHVITKVWYTHLGYERTKLAVEESLAEFKVAIDSDMIDFKLHVLLHWPRCLDNIPWMNCDKEESELPDYVRSAGPDPSNDPDNAWKESWRLLEDMYLSDKYPIASIGVSNFHLEDLERMDTFARIHPHILQVNIWSLLYDAQLVDYCHKHRVHIQVYNAIQGTVMKPEVAPRAFHHIQKIAYEMGDEIDAVVTPAQVILAWLIQHGVSVIPRTSRLARLEENSAVSLAKIPALTDMQVETVAHSVEAYLSGDDLAQDIHVSVSFHAVNKDIMLYWQGRDGNEVRIAHVKQGEVFNETTYPNHVFRTYDAANKDIFSEHQIRANFGDHKNIHVEL
jgi:diketogulonate reductase-like aldo/keto reductase